MIILYLFFPVVLLFIFAIRDLIHLIDEGRKGLVKNVPRILLGGFFTGCVGAAMLGGGLLRFTMVSVRISTSSCLTGYMGLLYLAAVLGIIGFLLGFLLGVTYLRRKFKRKEFKIPWKEILIIAALITVEVIGLEIGLHFYEASQRPAPPETPADCEKMTGIYSRDECYKSVAIKTKDASLCEKVTYKDGCYYGVAIETKDSSLCGKITDSERGDDCYQKIAIATKDASLCEKMDSKEVCYYEVAIETKDSSLCEKSREFADACYYEIAIKTKDASLCEKLSGGGRKDDCYKRAAQ